MKKRFLALFMCITILLSLCSCTALDNELTSDFEKPDNTALSVHYIDVGQGDSILLESNGSYVLIDAGETEYGPTVTQYIKSLGTDTIDYVIATHPHSDHIGGLADVINTFECKNFITKETDQQTKIWMNVLYAVENNSVNYIDAKVSDTYSFGDAEFEIVGPYSDEYDNYNDYSVIIKATCGDTSFLFTGDAEIPSEKEMVENFAPLKADVLKVGHHGSTTSSCEEFLDAVNPTYAVISCGINNDYGHPHKETLQALSLRGVTVYRTDELSTIIAYSNKKEIIFTYVNTDKVVQQATKPEETITPTVLETVAETIAHTTAPVENTDDSSSFVGDTGNSSQSSYVGNINSKKFHTSDCGSVKNMKDSNKVFFDSRDEAINEGYEGCKNCNP